MEENCRECELEATNIQFRPYGTAQNLPVIGKAKMKLKVGNGAEIETDCYINNDDKEESLLGESDTIRLGIIEINTQGAEEEVQINRVRQNKKQELEQDGQQLSKADQQRIDKAMDKVAEDHKEVFQGIGRYKGEPLKIQVEDGAGWSFSHPGGFPYTSSSHSRIIWQSWWNKEWWRDLWQRRRKELG